MSSLPTCCQMRWTIELGIPDTLYYERVMWYFLLQFHASTHQQQQQLWRTTQCANTQNYFVSISSSTTIAFRRNGHRPQHGQAHELGDTPLMGGRETCKTSRFTITNVKHPWYTPTQPDFFAPDCHRWKFLFNAHPAASIRAKYKDIAALLWREGKEHAAWQSSLATMLELCAEVAHRHVTTLYGHDCSFLWRMPSYTTIQFNFLLPKT